MRYRPAVAAVLLLGAVACHSGAPKASPTPTAPRRTTTAKIRIVEPQAGQKVGRTVTVKIAVDGAPVLDPNDTTATTGGHVHIYVDGKLYYMTKDLVQTVKLDPGTHNLRAEFVAPDHRPFLNPVKATVVFTVTA